jgi:hypothetical protein
MKWLHFMLLFAESIIIPSKEVCLDNPEAADFHDNSSAMHNLGR